MYRLLRNVGFRIDPERAHSIALRVHRIPRISRRSGSPIVVMGLEFPNVVGLAAGYDKDATSWRGLAGLGFGHIEVGTVTPLPQAGNPRPRVFRLPAEESLINRMGFPNVGADVVAARLAGRRHTRIVLGVSIGPNGFSDVRQAARDYESMIDRFSALADYLTINISSPNTPGLRTLESGLELDGLLGGLVGRRDRQGRTPMVVKLSPDIPSADLAETVAVIESAGIDGIIVSNTTTQRPGVVSKESGGLSGASLTGLSLDALHRVKELTDLPLIASGGVMTTADARERLDAGASLVQLYTGFVYRGPRLVRSVARLSAR